MAEDLIFTGLQPDDIDPDGCDVYGMLPLYYEPEDDASGKEDREDSEDAAVLEPTTIEVAARPGQEFHEDLNAYDALTDDREGLGVSPGEAQALADYMSPLSPEEAELEQEPLFDGIRWVDDPAHTADVLKAGKNSGGVDKFLNDATYGDSRMPTTFVAGRDDQKKALVTELSKKLVVEHANWLANQDKQSGFNIRPRSYYENVSRLWAKRELDRNTVPVTSSGDWSDSTGAFVGMAHKTLAETASKRARFSTALPNEVDLGDDSGWGLSSLTNVVKRGASAAYKYSGAKYINKQAKRGAGLAYKYSGAKYAVSKVQALALAPLKAIVRKYTNRIANNRAAYLAKQQGLAKPTPALRAQAASWTKDFVRKNNSKYGGAIVSLMGSDASGDAIGSNASTAGLIILGPIGLAYILVQMLTKSKSSGAPEDPNADPNADPDADPNAEADPNAQDAGDPGAETAADDGSTDSSEGIFLPRFVTVEQMQVMSPKQRARVQRAIRTGRVRVR